MPEPDDTTCFEGYMSANKTEAPHAVEEQFGIQVSEVRIVNRKDRPRLRYGRVVSHRPNIRKAYVKLAPGSKTPEFFESI